MKRNRIISIFLCIALVLSLVGCTSSSNPISGQSVQVTDMTGRTVQIEGTVERVVALTASECEILYALGTGERMVGRGEYCDYPKEASKLPVVQSGADTNMEQILALKPQVVLMSAMAQTDEQIAALEQAGIDVVVTDARDIQGVYNAISLVGEVVDRQEQASALIQSMKERFAAVKAKAAAHPGDARSVYFEVAPLEVGLWTAGSSTFMDEIAGMLQLKNIFADVNSWAEVSQEQVIDRNPDIIVTVTMYDGDGPAPEQEILSRAGWQGITAVKDRAVYQVDNSAFTRPGPRLADAAEALWDVLYD